ncbi:YvcK family protein [Candidatus Parcubacteria bacterium]|nr:MAG: YvcK family protein [Candidatus Parcubacteria bacterium]
MRNQKELHNSKSAPRIKRMRKPSFVVVGGGTGTFTVLSGLKHYPVNLAAVVAMADDGGSTGILRDELGVLPPGDVRQCLVALSSSDLLMRKLMNYRFSEGRLRGHSFGNLLLSALEKITGSFNKSVEKASEILRIQGKVFPATLSKVQLVATLQNGKRIVGEHAIGEHSLARLRKITLEPRARANPQAVQALLNADVIVIGPGDIYSSLIPNFLVRGIRNAICKSKALRVYVCNLMTKRGHTDGFRVHDFSSLLESYLGCSFDYVIYNTKKPAAQLLQKYAREGECYVAAPPRLPKSKFIGSALLNTQFPKRTKGDILVRNLIRHNPQRLAHVLFSLARSKKRKVL